MPKMTPREIKDFDLHRSCVHEMAHALVAEHYGHDTSIGIQPTHTKDLVNNKAWRGHIALEWGMRPIIRRRVGLAGEIAVAIVRGDFDLTEMDLNSSNDLREVEEYIHDLKGEGIISNTDLEYMEGWNTNDLKCVLKLLRKRWAYLLAEVEDIKAKVRIDYPEECREFADEAMEISERYAAIRQLKEEGQR